MEEVLKSAWSNRRQSLKLRCCDLELWSSRLWQYESMYLWRLPRVQHVVVSLKSLKVMRSNSCSPPFCLPRWPCLIEEGLEVLSLVI